MLCFCSSHFLEKISPQSQVPVTGYRIYVGGVDVAYTLGVLGHPRVPEIEIEQVQFTKFFWIGCYEKHLSFFGGMM